MPQFPLRLPTPPPLPAPPAVEHLLFESPWGLMAGAVALGVLAAGRLVRRGQTRLAGVAIVVAGVVSAGLALLARAVETPREQMAEGTRMLIAAVARSDTAAVRALMSDRCRLYVPFAPPAPPAPPEGLDANAIVSLIPGFLHRRWPLQELTILELQSQTTTRDRGRTQMCVRAVPEATGVPYVSWWLIHWARHSSGPWQVTTIEPVDLPGVPVRR